MEVGSKDYFREFRFCGCRCHDSVLMTRITIITKNTGEAEISYRAIAREHEGIGRTAGAALDALTEQLDPAETETVIVVQKARPRPVPISFSPPRSSGGWRSCLKSAGMRSPASDR
jgi:hypothetical protein